MFLRPSTFRAITSRIPSLRPAIVMEAGKIRQYTEGATGSGYSRPTGEAGGDSFTKREKAQEDMFIRKEEAERVKALKLKIKESQRHLDELEKHLEDFVDKQGGEHN